MFVTVEGIEGCGKSTLISGLAVRLREEGREVLVTREPGGTPVGDAIRGIFLEPGPPLAPLTEALLINAARAQHVVEVILPALRANKIVLCDRFVDSTLAYQGFGRGIDRQMLENLCSTATGDLGADVTFVLDIPVTISHERIAARKGRLDRMESEDEGFHERVRGGFLTIASVASRYRVLDATKSPHELLEQAHRELREREKR